MKTSLQLKLSQHLALTPQLQQSIRLLQLSTLELNQELDQILADNPLHHLDDSVHGVGRYDIYTADVWLFTEPLADRIGPLWLDGLRTALGLVERTLADDGTAVAWGRSTGSLGAALTVELAAASLCHGVGDDPERWVARGRRAARVLPDLPQPGRQHSGELPPLHPLRPEHG